MGREDMTNNARLPTVCKDKPDGSTNSPNVSLIRHVLKELQSQLCVRSPVPNITHTFVAV